MKLPKSLTRVTWFSKSLALLIFLAFIFAAFWAGLTWNKQNQNFVSQITPTPTTISSSQNTCKKDSDCVLADLNQNSICCPNTKCINFAESSVVAVNEDWLGSLKQSQCAGRMCPMIAVMCTRQIQEENLHYKAVCVSYTCQKVRQ